MDAWFNEVRQAARNTASLTPANQIVLAYQFSQARVTHPEGFTMDLYGQVIHPEHGYVVGMTEFDLPNVADALTTLAHLEDTYGFQNLHLGFWRDPEGKDYIDVVMVTDSRELALTLGKQTHQRAVWDFATNGEVWIDGNGNSDDRADDDTRGLLPRAA